jgi:hypothetical protein
MATSSILKRKYQEEVPDSAKYQSPAASIPSRRTQIKIVPEGKTSFGPNEIIRIHVPPQGYFDPEFSYLSFDITLQAPTKYMLKALEVWNSDSAACIYDPGFGGLIVVGKQSSRQKAKCVPIMRNRSDMSGVSWVYNTDTEVLFEFVPVGQVYPVLPFSSHGFFNRVVIRTANNTPVEDIQDYDYLCAHLGQLLQSEGYVSTMGAMLEGWGDINTRAKMGLSCVSNLKVVIPTPDGGVPINMGVTNEGQIFSASWAQPVDIQGLSPEGTRDSSLKETVKGTKLTCNLNLGLLQQQQNLPLLFSGGLILELYTAPFERCMSFTTIWSRFDPTDVPNLADGGIIGGHADVIDVTCMNERLPYGLTTALGWSHETSSSTDSVTGMPLNSTGNAYYQNGCMLYNPSTTDTNYNKQRMNLADVNFMTTGKRAPGDYALAYTGSNTAYQCAADGTYSGVAFSIGTQHHNSYQEAPLKARFDQFMTGWTYTLSNVELRADMVQFSQAYDESVAQIVDSDEGLPITFQTFSTQKVIYNGQRETITMNERARSVQFALAVFKESSAERSTHTFAYDSDTRFTIAAQFAMPISQTRLDGWRGDYGKYDNADGQSWPTDTTADHTFTSRDGSTSIQVQSTEQTHETGLNTASTSNDTVHRAITGPWAYAAEGVCHFHGYTKQKFLSIANPWVVNMRVIPIDGQQQSLFPSLIDYQFRIGTRFIPASPVDCSSGAVQAYVELMKAIGLYGSSVGDGKRSLLGGNRVKADLYSKRICTSDSKTVTGAYSTVPGTSVKFAAVPQGVLVAQDYFGLRYRVPARFILGQNFSDIPDHAAGVDTATQALSIELSLNGQSGTQFNCYVFLNVRRDMFIRCGGQIEILY